MAAYDSNGNRVGYGTLNARTTDDRSLTFSVPAASIYKDRFVISVTDLPSPTSKMHVVVREKPSNKIIYSANWSAKASTIDDWGAYRILVCASSVGSGCDVSADIRTNTQYQVTVTASELYYVLERSSQTFRTNFITAGGRQGSPPDPPTPTPVNILIGVGVHNSSQATVPWGPVSGATGYVLEYSGSDMKSGSYTLGAGVTNQRLTGLTPGANYRAKLTVNLADGGKGTGEIFFTMPVPPANTPIPPPTNTPLPPSELQQPEPPPPSNTPIPPTPVPLPTNTPVRLPSQSEDNQQQPSGPYASLIQTLLTYQAETQHGKPHVERWTRALAALGWGSHANPMTLAEAEQMARQFSANRWNPVAAALRELQPPPPTPIPPTPVPPTPVPPTPVPPTPVPQPPSYTVPQSLINTLKDYEAETQYGPEHVLRWTRALAALGHGSHGDPMTLSEAKQMARQFSATRWNPVVDALEKLAGN